MLKSFFRRGDERKKEEYRMRTMHSYELTEQYAVDSAVKNLMIEPDYLNRYDWNAEVGAVDPVTMARMAGLYPLCFPAIRKLYTGEQPVEGEVFWHSPEERQEKLQILQQRMKYHIGRMAADMAADPKLINDLNDIDWNMLPHQLSSLNDIYKFAAVYRFRFPAYAYAYTGKRFPVPDAGQTFEEAWKQMSVLDDVNMNHKRKGR